MKYYRLKILLSSIVMLSINYCMAQSDSTEKANQIIKLEQKLADALPVDSVLWSKYTDPKWYIVNEDGSVMFKQEFLKTFGPFPKQISLNVKVIKPVFSFHNNIAVINYVADEHETAYGQKLHTTYSTMDTWYKTDTSWVMLSMLNFEIPALPPAIKVDSKTLQQYTGTYKLTDEKLAVIILKNDTLFVQKNKGKTEALLPETINVFFREADTRGRKIFVKNENGQMLMLERRNGQDLVWKRIK